ncbi:MAG: hypothetical protein MK096_00640 [Oleiphilaceae bacterium]|nr:hypothetical protein [Oleiphilaceae bacterium]
MTKIFLALFVLSITEVVNAQQITETGLIHQLLIIDKPDGQSNAWVTLHGFQSAGDCGAVSSGLVRLYVPANEAGQRQFSALLAAKIADKQVTLRVDTTVRNPDKPEACMLHYVLVQD